MESSAAAESPPLPRSEWKQPGVVFVLAAVHALALLLLYLGVTLPVSVNADGPPNTIRVLLCVRGWLGLVCGQISLAAILAALAPLPPLVRLPLGVFCAGVGWALLLVALPATSGTSSGAWAIMVGLQFVLTLSATWLAGVCLRTAEGKTPGGMLGQYSIATLLALTAFVAIVLGILRWAVFAFGWDASVMRWEWFLHLQVIGLFNAALATLAVTSLLGTRWTRWRRTWGLILAIVLVAHEPFFLDALFRSTGADYGDLWMIGGVQIFVLYGTLFAVRWGGGLSLADR